MCFVRDRMISLYCYLFFLAPCFHGDERPPVTRAQAEVYRTCLMRQAVFGVHFTQRLHE